MGEFDNTTAIVTSLVTFDMTARDRACTPAAGSVSRT
jgi:hypothetical protein